MPNLDGTGPQGKGSGMGKRKGRCRDAKAIQNTTIVNPIKETPSEEKDNTFNGLGRGGKPRDGGGMGTGFGGGKGRGWGA